MDARHTLSAHGRSTICKANKDLVLLRYGCIGTRMVPYLHLGVMVYFGWPYKVAGFLRVLRVLRTDM